MSSSDPFVDKLTIETPEQTSLDFPLAGIGSRFLALALDLLLQTAAFLLLFAIAAWVLSGRWEFWRGGWSWAAAMMLLLGFLLYYGYFAAFEAVWNGQTPGKRFVHLRVIQESGRPITVYQAIGRNLLRIVDQLPGIYAVAIVAVLLSRQNKRLGDYVAGTVVVHEKPLEAADFSLPERAGRPVASTMPQEARPGFPRFNAARLGAEELQLLETFLLRRAHLPPDVRAQMAHQIAERLAGKLAIPPEERTTPAFPGGDEAFLEALAEERRSLAGFSR